MTRVVLDTNIVVSAMLRSGGPPEAVLSLALCGEVQCYVSEPIIAEYSEVLLRPRFAIQSQKVATAIQAIREAALLISPGLQLTAALDPDDNMFLECAQAAQAHYLVTGNRKHFPSRWLQTLIVTPREFMDAYALGLEEPGS